MHFVTVTALRREAVLGLEWRNVNAENLFLTVDSEIDKKDTTRYKPLTSDLLDEMLELKSFGQATGKYRERLFAWPHSQKTWYKVWNNAEMLAGVKLGLHDLKRFSGELALRTGATDLKLIQHMDHSNIHTTLNHYCRPKTTNLVSKIRVPLPDEFSTDPPPNSAAASLAKLTKQAQEWNSIFSAGKGGNMKLSELCRPHTQVEENFSCPPHQLWLTAKSKRHHFQ